MSRVGARADNDSRDARGSGPGLAPFSYISEQVLEVLVSDLR